MIFTKGLAKQLAPKGIRVDAVAPGPVWTALQGTGGHSACHRQQEVTITRGYMQNRSGFAFAAYPRRQTPRVCSSMAANAASRDLYGPLVRAFIVSTA